MNMQTPLRALGCSVTLLAGTLAACSMNPSTAEERDRVARSDGEIVVAVPWPWQTRSELLYADGLALAVDEVNAAGGVHGRRLRLLRVDDQESVNEGRLVAQQIAENPRVLAVIGHLQSYVTVPAAAIYDLAGLVLVSPASTSAELTSRGYPRVFRATLTDQAIGRQVAEFALDRGYRRVAIYYLRNKYGRALANAFEERSHGSALAVVARHSYDSDQELADRMLEPVLRQWRYLDLDAIFLAGEVPLASHLIAAIREAGIRVPILGPDAMSSPELIAQGGEAVEGVVLVSFFHPDEPRRKVRTFVSRFRDEYGREPDVAAALGYDAVKLLAHAMQMAETPAPTHVAQALHALRDWEGVTGRFSFDERGELIRPRAVQVIVQDGAFEFLPGATLTAVHPQGVTP